MLVLQADWFAEHVSVGGQARLRVEWKDPVDYRLPGTFGRPADERPTQSDEWAVTRLRLHGSVEFDATFRAYLEVQDAHTLGTEAAAAPEPKSDVSLRQAYLDVREITPWLSLRIGRQELSYGDQRLISPLDWSHIARTWDGVRATLGRDAWKLDLFATSINEGVVKGHNRFFHGIYAMCRAIEKHEFDLYLLRREFERNRITRRMDWTLGARMKGARDPWDYSAEIAYQSGEAGRAPTRDVRAWGWAVTAGHTFTHDWRPRVGVEWTFASGDEDPTDDALETFTPPFPFAHAYQGYIDIFAWRNGHNLAMKASVRPHERWTLALDLHSFWLHERRDAWFDAAGRPIRRDATGATGGARHVGIEADLHARWKPSDRVDIWMGISHFWPGAYVDQTGFDPEMTWGFAQITITF